MKTSWPAAGSDVVWDYSNLGCLGPEVGAAEQRQPGPSAGADVCQHLVCCLQPFSSWGQTSLEGFISLGACSGVVLRGGH